MYKSVCVCAFRFFLSLKALQVTVYNNLVKCTINNIKFVVYKIKFIFKKNLPTTGCHIFLITDNIFV